MLGAPASTTLAVWLAASWFKLQPQSAPSTTPEASSRAILAARTRERFIVFLPGWAEFGGCHSRVLPRGFPLTGRSYKRAERRRRALPMTLTELRLIAA